MQKESQRKYYYMKTINNNAISARRSASNVSVRSEHSSTRH